MILFLFIRLKNCSGDGRALFCQINGDNMIVLKSSSTYHWFEFQTNSKLKKVYSRVNRNVYSDPAHRGVEKRKIVSVAESKPGLYKDINHCKHTFCFNGCLYFTTYILNALNREIFECLHVLKGEEGKKITDASLSAYRILHGGHSRERYCHNNSFVWALYWKHFSCLQ